MYKSKHKWAYSIALPLLLISYVVLAGFGKITLNRGELFPFFSWSLFSGFHERAPHYMIHIHSVDGQSDFTESNYISANNHPLKIRVEKAIRLTLRQCAIAGMKEQCVQEVSNKIVPLVGRIFVDNDISFSVILCSYDFDFVKQKFLVAQSTVPIFNREGCVTEQISGPWSNR